MALSSVGLQTTFTPFWSRKLQASRLYCAPHFSGERSMAKVQGKKAAAAKSRPAARPKSTSVSKKTAKKPEAPKARAAKAAAKAAKAKKPAAKPVAKVKAAAKTDRKSV